MLTVMRWFGADFEKSYGQAKDAGNGFSIRVGIRMWFAATMNSCLIGKEGKLKLKRLTRRLAREKKGG